MSSHREAHSVVLLVGHLLTLAGAVAGGVFSLGVLLSRSAAPLHVALPQMFPFAEMSLSVDGLSAFFLLVPAAGTSRRLAERAVSAAKGVRCPPASGGRASRGVSSPHCQGRGRVRSAGGTD